MKTAYQLWKEDQAKRQKQATQDAAQGKVNFKEASKASRVQYSLPGYQGDSKEKSYNWETDQLKSYKANRKGVRSYNDKFDNMTKRMGMSPGQADDYRRSLDFSEDSKQEYKLNKDGSPNQAQNIRAGQGAHLQSDIIDGIFKNMYANQAQSISNNQRKQVQKAKDTLELTKKTSKERDGLLGVLDKTLGRAGDAAHRALFGNDFVNTENENYQKLAVDKLNKNTKDKNALKALQMLNTTARAPKTKTEKAADFIGTAAGELAPYTVGGAYGAADAILGKAGLNSIKSPIVKDLIRGIGAGTIAGTEKAVSRGAASGEKLTPKEYAKHIGLEAALAGGGDAALGSVLRNLNLKGQLKTLLKDTGTKSFNEQEFKQALEKTFAPKGNVSNVVADTIAPKGNPQQVLDQFLSKTPKIPNVKTTPQKALDDIALTDTPKVETPDVLKDPVPEPPNWLNFGQSSKYAPKARTDLSPVEQSLDPLNRPQAYWKDRYEGFVQEMGKQGYNPNNLSKEAIDGLWTQYAKYDEPVSLDNAVELAYGNGPQSKLFTDPGFDPTKRLEELFAPKPTIKEALKADPRITEALQKLSDLAPGHTKYKLNGNYGESTVDDAALNLLGDKAQGKPLSQAIEQLNSKYNELAKGKGKDEVEALQQAYKVEQDAIYQEFANQPLNKSQQLGNPNPVAKLQELLSNTKSAEQAVATTAAPKKSLLSMKDLFGHLEAPKKETNPNPEPIAEITSKPVVMKSFKPSKDVNTMSRDELQKVYEQLNEQKKTYSKGKKTSQSVQAIQEDIDQVKKLLLKMDLQLFGEAATIPPELLPDTRSQIGTKTVKQPGNIKAAVDKGYIKTVDNLHRLNQFDRQVEQVLGKKLDAAESTHTLGLNSRGSDMISKQILTENMVDKTGEVVGKSLKEITMKVPKGKLKDFEDYLINRHAITRMERGEKVFPNEMEMTPDKSRAIIKNYDAAHPEFKEIAKEYYEYNKQLGQKWLVDMGVLSKDEWEGYLKANPNYVPNNRIFSDIERPLFYGAKKGFGNQSNPMKKAVGSQRKIVSPIESTIEHTAQYIKTAKRNEVMQTLINNIKQNPDAFKEWAEIVPTEKGAGTVLDSISNKLQNEGIDAVLDEFNKAFDQKPDLTKGNIVRGLIEGNQFM
jgi:hypothetical protein